jgi:hypothetical protein
MSNAQAIEIEGVIPMSDVAKALHCNRLTARRFCDLHRIPITRLSRKAHALTQGNYALLLSRATEAS